MRLRKFIRWPHISCADPGQNGIDVRLIQNRLLPLRKDLMLGLIGLPYEVLANVVSNVDIDDVLSLALTCKELSYLLTEESICKIILETKISFTHEAREAKKRGGGNASALRRAVKRREALAEAHPYVLATVGFCDAYIYCKGFLCYSVDDTIRVLDLHHSAQHEIVVSIPELLKQCLPIEEHSKGIFQILYYSDRIISCVYQALCPDSTAWLIAFHLGKRRILVVQELDSTDKIFVRHNSQFLYYGTHSDVGVDNYKKWVIHGYDFQRRKWFDHKIHLPDMVGSEIGLTICFEFHKEHFYAISNQTSFEVEEIDWTSFYHCIRFPLSSPCKELLEKTENQSMWRRQHQEGPIDDRWTCLKLDVDESTGELKIVESRKEWALGSSRSQRTYYTTKIKWPESLKGEDMGFEPLSSAPNSLASASAGSSTFNSVSTSSSTTGRALGVLSSTPSATTSASLKHFYGLSTLPDDPILKLLRPDDNPHHMAPPPRRAHETHPGDDGSTKPSPTLSKCRIRCYHTCSSAFLDLVDDPLPTDWQGTQRLHLRSGSRKLGPPLVHPSSHPTKARLLRGPSNDLQTALKELYREQPIQNWPPLNTTDVDFNAIYRLLNPPSHLGNVEGTADERSMVYVTGGYDKPQAIIFIGFDPAMKLAGLKRWGGLDEKGLGEGPHIDGRATGQCSQEGDLEKVHVDVEIADRMLSIERKGKGREAACTLLGGHAVFEVSTAPGRDMVGGKGGKEGRKYWAWKEKAMYMDIGLGFYFGREKREEKRLSSIS